MALNINCHFPLQVPTVGFSSCSDPGMLKNLLSCVAFLGIHYQQPAYQIFGCYFMQKEKERREKYITMRSSCPIRANNNNLHGYYSDSSYD